MAEAARWPRAPRPEAVLAVLPPERACVLLHDAGARGRSALLWDADAVVAGRLRPRPDFRAASRGTPARRWPLADHDPAARVQREQDAEQWSWPEGAEVFGPAWAGWWSFACGHAWEPFPWTEDATALPDYHWARFRQALVWPRDGGLRWLDARVGSGARVREAERAQWERRLQAAARAPAATDAEIPALRPEEDGARFRARVERLRAWIGAGELFQANLAHRLAGPAPRDPRATYAALCRRQPTRMSAYWQDGAGAALIAHSPERFLRVQGALLETQPIKGTAERGADAREDRARAAGLASSEKERAELTMIVDMARHDLGRVALPGSVEVVTAGRVERYPTLLHRTAHVRARWDPSAGPAALLGATFPPASVTGAPKVRALQAIAELEERGRGPYCGALGWWSPGEVPHGDACVLIRTATATPAGTVLPVGAGIVWDSDAGREWREVLVKAKYWRGEG